MNKYQRIIITIVGLTSLVAGVMYIGMGWGSRGIPFIGKPYKWSLGIYMGESPFNFVSPGNMNNPVLAAADVSDVPADFVADPFMLQENNTWYMFFEVMNLQTDQGDIGLATSADGLNWTYKQIVLDESFHLSYPYVFKWANEHYMIPESAQANSVRLYKAVDFPTQWVFVETLLKGDYKDPSVFYFDGRWWMFVGSPMNDTLWLYYAEELTGSWIEHPASPIVEGDANIARPGGRVIEFDGRIIRYAQDDDPIYGHQVRAFEITELTTLSYEDKQVTEKAILKASGTGWNANGMHHIDPHQIDENKWVAAVDGFKRGNLVFGLQY